MRKLLAKILRVSPEVLEFVSDNRKRYYKKLAIVLPLTAWTSFLYQIYPIFTKFQIDALTDGKTIFGSFETSQTWMTLIYIVGLMLFLQLFDAGLKFWKDNVIERLNQQSGAYLEDKFINFLTKFDSSFLDSENNLRLVRNLQYSFDGMENKINNLFTKSIELVVSLVALIGIIPLIHPYLVALIFLSVSINIFLDMLQNNAWRRYELVENRKNDLRNEIRWRLIWDFNRILGNGWLKQIYQNYESRRKEWFEIKYNQGVSDRKYGILKDSLNAIMQALTSLAAGWLVIQKFIQLGTFVVFGLYISRVQGFLENIGSIFRTIVELRFDLFRMEFLLNIKSKLDYSQIQKFESKEIMSLKIQDLNFTYPKFFAEESDYLNRMRERLGLLDEQLEPESKDNTNSNIFSISFWKEKILALYKRSSQSSLGLWEKKQLKKELSEIEKLFLKAAKNEAILKDLSIEFRRGNIYAIVGYNGAGKTTLTKLIKRTLDPSSGEILIDGRNLKTIDPVHWKSYISSLEQESFVWESFSIRDNLTLGAEQKYEDTELLEALNKVGLGKVITDLDQVFGEGIELSGGQKQLLEIARVYLQKKPILILDEGTNQVDAMKENHILNTLQEIKKHAIIIFITHRMTTCSKCDHILVLDHGQIVATGNHKSLLDDKNGNLYQTFWNVQVLGQEESV